MSDLFENHIVGFPTRWLKFCSDILTDAKRGRGRPKKRKLEGEDNAGKIR